MYLYYIILYVILYVFIHLRYMRFMFMSKLFHMEIIRGSLDLLQVSLAAKIRERIKARETCNTW